MQALTKKRLRDLKGLSGQLAAITLVLGAGIMTLVVSIPDGRQPMISQLYLREGRLSDGVRSEPR